MPALIDEKHQRTYRWKGNEAVIGRTPDNTIQIDAPGISRHHCRIVVGKEGYLIEDLNSRNGTKLNQQKLPTGQRSPIRPGDVVTLNQYDLRFQPETSEPGLAGSEKKKDDEESGLRFADESSPGRKPSPPPPSKGGPQHERQDVLCPKCKVANLPDAETCWNCKETMPSRAVPVAVPKSQMATGGFCPSCHARYAAGTTQCPSCGMNLGDRRAVVGSGFYAQRHAFYLAAFAVVGIMVLVGILGVLHLSRKRREQAESLEIQVIKVRLDRASQALAQAQQARQLQQPNRALDRYQEAASLAKAIMDAAQGPALLRLKERGRILRDQIQSEQKEYEMRLEQSPPPRPKDTEAHPEESADAKKLILFHGGQIDAQEAGLIRQDNQAGLPEEWALEKALAAPNRTATSIDPALQAFLLKAWEFQEHYYLDLSLWKPVISPLPGPVPIPPGSRGLRYPPGVATTHFPGVYLARLLMAEKNALPHRMTWENNGVRITTVFSDNTRETEAATQTDDLLILSQNIRPIGSVVTASFLLPLAQEPFAAVQTLSRSETPPILQIAFKVTGITEKSSSREVPHMLKNGTELVQVLTRLEYTLSLEVLHGRWFRRLSGNASPYVPLLLEQEPKDGLYDVARRALARP
jgi:hypothetical protein